MIALIQNNDHSRPLAATPGYRSSRRKIMLRRVSNRQVLRRRILVRPVVLHRIVLGPIL
jgi:hypothetical protein